MAHSAAPLAYLYGGTSLSRGRHPSDALKYKVDAVSILNTWFSDPEMALNNDAFTAVIRLLNFEVCTSAELKSGNTE
jgi:hypothetical protein